MQYEIIVGPRDLKVLPAVSDDLYSKISEATSYVTEGYQFTTAAMYKGWDGRVYYFKNNRAPSGLYLTVAGVIAGSGNEVMVRFTQNYVPAGKLFVNDLTLKDYQEMAVLRSAKYRYCTVFAPVRSGKTAIIGALINYVAHYPVCIVTTGRDLVRQTAIEIERFTQKPIGFFSESAFAPEDILVTSYQALAAIVGTLSNNRASRRRKRSANIVERNASIFEFLSKVKVLFLDECQFSFGAVLSKIWKRFSSVGYRIALSGTPIPDSKHNVEATAINGPVVTHISYRTLVKQNRLAVPKIILYDLPRDWFEGGLDMHKNYEVNIVNNVRRNEMIIKCVEGLHKCGKSCFVMTYWLEHAKILRRMLNKTFLVQGKTPIPTRFEMYSAVQEQKLKCVITTVGKIGLNLPKLDAVINAEGRSSNTLTIQKMRSLTACDGKKHGLVIDFLDKGPMRKQALRRLHHYKKVDGAVLETRKVGASNGERGKSAIIRYAKRRPHRDAHRGSSDQAATAEFEAEGLCGKIGCLGRDEKDRGVETV